MRQAIFALAVAALLAGCGSSAHRSTLPTPTATTRISQSALDTEAHTTTGAYVTPVATIQLVQPLARYEVYVDKLLGTLRTQITALHAATLHGTLAQAERAWGPAHFSWLELGQDDASYGAFGQLGQQIDGTADGLVGTTANPSFTGFHRVEFDLWRRHDLGAAAHDSERLQTLAAKLTPSRVQHDLPLTAKDIDSWVLRAHEILEDGLRDSLTQIDDYGSNSDLASLAADVNATHEMLDVLGPLIKPRGPSIMPRAATDLRTLEHAIVTAGGTTAHRNLAALPVRQRDALNAATGAAVETLAPVSDILQITVAGS